MQDRFQLLETPRYMAETFLHHAARVVEMQASAVRALMRAQARSAAALGAPDWSPLFGNESERQFSDYVRTSTDQAVALLRRTNEHFHDLQNAVNEMFAGQANELTATIRASAPGGGSGAQNGPADMRITAEEAADIVQQAAASGMQGTATNRKSRS